MAHSSFIYWNIKTERCYVLPGKKANEKKSLTNLTNITFYVNAQHQIVTIICSVNKEILDDGKRKLNSYSVRVSCSWLFVRLVTLL